MSWIIGITVLSVGFLAFSNGANDNFKGVATLLGSKTATYRKALAWATLTTAAGSLMAVFFAEKLFQNFSGKGLFPSSVIQLPVFPVTVALASATTVFLATRLGFPVSTTHALVGAMVGAGWVANSEMIQWTSLGKVFFLPLLLSPFLAFGLTTLVYPMMTLLRKRLGVRRESCLCLGSEILAFAPQAARNGDVFLSEMKILPTITVGTSVVCEERYVGEFVGVKAKNLLDSVHFLSSGLVGFSRGLNDAPKIAAILFALSTVSSTLSKNFSVGMVALLMAVGGLLMARRVAETMSYQITEMNDGQGFSANIVTAFVGLCATAFGLSVSTTHVSCGAIFGIGTIQKKADFRVIYKIILSWILTLPLAALLGGVIFWVFNRT